MNAQHFTTAAQRHIHTIQLDGISCDLGTTGRDKLATFTIEGAERASWTVTGPIDLQMLFADDVADTLAQGEYSTQAHAGMLAHSLDWYGTPAIILAAESGKGDAFMLLHAGSMGDEYDAHEMAATM